MSIAALVSGKLIANSERRTGPSGKPFALARIGTTTEDGDCIVSVIAFGPAAEQLAALAKGDSVAVTGRAKVSTWTGKDGALRAGLSVVADQLLTPYHVQRKRQAMRESSERRPGEPLNSR